MRPASAGSTTIQIKRVYEPCARTDGARFLVERLCPRGIKKEELDAQQWLKEVAPSTELRQWFAHDPSKWREFKLKYFAELQRAPHAWQPILQAAKKRSVTLLYSARDSAHNSAVALQEFLDAPLNNS